MIETPKHTGIFTVFSHPGYSTAYLREWFKAYGTMAGLQGLELDKEACNLLMSAQKLLMANAVYPSIDKLVITSQTSTPSDNETSYSGTIYTTVAADEFARSGNVNPYQVQWNITSESANGAWGSFILITSTGAMINRALAGVTKSSGQGKLVTFTGSVS